MIEQYKKLSLLHKLIAINVIVFLLINIVKQILLLSMQNGNSAGILTSWLAMPTYLPEFFIKPYTLISYMFTHSDFFHILFNMLYLYWMGKLFVDYLGEKKLLAVYILGGLAGGILQLLAENLIPLYQVQNGFPPILGASAAVMAILVAVATLIPEQQVLLLVFPIKLKWIAVFTILIDVLNLAASDSTAHFAHIGGAAFGFLFIRQLQQGKDWSKGFSNLIEKISGLFQSKPKMKVHYSSTNNTRNDEQFNYEKNKKQERIDDILDKISKSGYGSLSQEERDFLFNASKK